MLKEHEQDLESTMCHLLQSLILRQPVTTIFQPLSCKALLNRIGKICVFVIHPYQKLSALCMKKAPAVPLLQSH